MKIQLSREFKPWVGADLSRNPEREALSTISFDPKGLAVSADGFMVTVVPCTITNGCKEPVLIPARWLAWVDKLLGKATEMVISIEDDRAIVEIQAVGGAGSTGQSVSAPLSIATFPKWRQIVPREQSETNEYQPFNLDFLTRAAKAIGLSNERIRLVSYGRSNAAVMPNEPLGAFAVVMPMFYGDLPSAAFVYDLIGDND